MSNIPDRPDLDALALLEAAATPGPWKADANGDVLMANPPHGWESRCVAVTDYSRLLRHNSYLADAALIAAARTALPALIAYARKIEGERDEAVWSRDLWQEDCRLQYENRDYWRTRTETAEAECERLRGLLSTVERKLGYLLRDYPDDKETTGLIESIRKERTHVR